MGEVSRVVIQPTITGPDAPPAKGERPPSSPQGGRQTDQGQPQNAPPGKPQDNAAQRPEWMPEKFWKDGKADFEGLAKSYGELEKKGAKPELKVEKPNGEHTPKANEQPAAHTPPPQGQASIPGVTQEQTTKYTTELTEGGKLSDGSYGELEKAGYPRNVVDAYIRGIQAEQAQGAAQVTELKKLAGGDEGYSAMAEWMSANLDAAELSEYNDAVTSGKNAIIKLAVQGMHARYKEAIGETPNLLGGKGNQASTGDVFRSQAEVTAAMRDPRYKKDEAYRQDVAAKIGRSRLRK